jgi:hypothetical protein
MGLLKVNKRSGSPSTRGLICAAGRTLNERPREKKRVRFEDAGSTGISIGLFELGNDFGRAAISQAHPEARVRPVPFLNRVPSQTEWALRPFGIAL